MKLRSLTFACVFTLCLGSGFAEARLWKDQQGRPMTADFVEAYEKDGQKMVVFSKGNGLRYEFPLSRLSDADQQYIADLEAGKIEAPVVTDLPLRAKTEFEADILKNLVRVNGSRVSRVSNNELEPKKYYAIYFSAHWCGPCRTFTPKLVDFYNEASAQHDQFEIIFVSSDADEDAMEGYMEEFEMPWLALDYDRKESAKELTQFSGSGIPCLVLVDRNGKVLKHSYENGDYMGPTRVMDDLKIRLGGEA